MTTENAIARNFRIIQATNHDNRNRFYVQKRFFLIFWLIILNREGFPSLEEAKQAIYMHLFTPDLAYVRSR
jgi:hypothetical protein